MKQTKKVAKGVPKASIKNQLRHSVYTTCLDQLEKVYTTTYGIRSDKHQLFTMQQCKLSLAPYEDKRYVLQKGRDTLAYGHYSTKRESISPPPPPPSKRKRETSSSDESQEIAQNTVMDLDHEYCLPEG